ncbi:HWE histidine kinase domain-containing protein [Erythrobacter sp.]|uniref:HWE histidine kinase domain-containing protein n=1 Tax=Erythrobacter sp. TaxID=1042 RepID=UPI0025FE0271|nr:HWE histidine kinase domain-containing protein [Erythrobacter sp.]
MNMEDLYRLLRTGHVQAQGIVDTICDPLVVLDSNLCVQNANRAFFETFKVERDETIGERLYSLGNGQWDIPALRNLLGEVIPKATAIINYEVEHTFPTLGRRTMLLTARTLYHPDGMALTMLLTIVDATDRQRRELAKDLLFGELRHRMKNLLGLTRAIARQTTTTGRSAEEYRDVFLGRLSALIEAEEVAFSEHKEAGLAELLDRTFAAFDTQSNSITIEPGEPVELSPSEVMSLSLVLHELTTNAVKYGALSVPDGELRVSWRTEGGNVLRLQWQESGGPSVTLPIEPGYGAELIHSSITYNLQGRMEQDYTPDGLRAEFVIPLGKAEDIS